MTMENVIEELSKYGFTFEEILKIYKCVVKKRYNVLELFENDLAERIGVKDAQLVMERIKTIPVEKIGINPLHSMVYSMGKELTIDTVHEKEEGI